MAKTDMSAFVGHYTHEDSLRIHASDFLLDTVFFQVELVPHPEQEVGTNAPHCRRAAHPFEHGTGLSGTSGTVEDGNHHGQCAYPVKHTLQDGNPVLMGNETLGLCRILGNLFLDFIVAHPGCKGIYGQAIPYFDTGFQCKAGAMFPAELHELGRTDCIEGRTHVGFA